MLYTNKILRNFRRFYLNDFQTITNFKTGKGHKSKEFIVKWLEDYWSKRFGNMIPEKDDLVFWLGTLLLPTELSRTSIGRAKKSRREINKIHDTLYRFSISKVDSLLNDKNVAYLLRYFIKNSSWKDDLIRMSELSSKSYQTAFDMILTRSENLLAK